MPIENTAAQFHVDARAFIREPKIVLHRFRSCGDSVFNLTIVYSFEQHRAAPCIGIARARERHAKLSRTGFCFVVVVHSYATL